jgi:peptide/nickel transport system substrate-binding protein
LALIVSACGTNAEKPAGSSTTGMTVLTGGEPRSMNCAVVSAFDQMISTAFVERLVPTDDDFKPTTDGLVDEWKQTGPNTWRLHVREGVTFSNGEAWDAEALKFSLDTLRTTEGAVMAFFKPFAKVTVDDPANVTVETTAPTTAIPALLAFGCAFPPKYYQEVGADGFGQKPIGTGPYVLQTWDSGQQVTAVKNKAYWGGAPKLEKLTWKFVPDQTTRVNLLVSGGGDVALDVPVDRISDVEGAGLEVRRSATGNQQNIQMNTTSGQLASRELREAVAHSIDRAALVEAMFGGDGVGAETTENWFPPAFGTTGRESFQLDPERAKELVKSAGGGKLTLHYTVGRYPKDQEVGEAVAGMLTAVGFDVERVPMDGSEFFAAKSKPGFDGLWIAAGAAVLPHPDVLVGAFLGSRPLAKYCPAKEYDQEGVRGLAAGSEDELKEIYSAVEDQVLNKDICFVPLYVANGLTGTAKDVNLRLGYDTLVDYRALGWK